MTVLSRWKIYRGKTHDSLRKHVVGEDMKDIRVNEADKENCKHPGGMVRRDAHDPLKQAYVSKMFFDANYVADKE